MADRLIHSAIEVTIDIYDLKEGMDKNAFMERMVNSAEISHVLIVCDKKYAEKADARTKGVGTESQIISEKVYSQINQTKFIPLVCEFDEEGGAILPSYLKSRIWIDISSEESLHRNWEQLVRVLYGKALHQKPSLGKPPAFLSDTAAPSLPFRIPFQLLKQSLVEQRPASALHREDFFSSCFSYIKVIRNRERMELTGGEAVLEEFRKLKDVRNALVDWIILEGNLGGNQLFQDQVVNILERIMDPGEISEISDQFNVIWGEAYKLFKFELFLYFVAALTKLSLYPALKLLFTEGYMRPAHARYNNVDFEGFDGFYASSDVINAPLAKKGYTYYSAAAELIRREADRSDVNFNLLMEADLIAFFMSLVSDSKRWYPQLLLYAKYNSDFPVFLKAARRRDFLKLLDLTGASNQEDLKARVADGYKRLGVHQWSNYRFEIDLLRLLNIEKWDSIK